MDQETLEKVAACLPSGRTVFHYFDDRYALLLLEYAARDGVPIRELKRGPFARLLRRPRVRRLLARAPAGVLRAEDVRACWPARPWGYRVTFGRWPLAGERWRRGWHQMTRRGHNLVVQLNFAQSHNRRARAILGRAVEDALPACHPVARAREITLGWTRVDVDFGCGEALIEEIQSDWIREARDPCTCEDPTCDGARWARYGRELLLPHVRCWDEALLAATLWTLRDRLGLRRIFLHTHETGTRLKHQQGWPGPRSLYTRLPRRFCFRTTHAGPHFLKRERDRKLRRALIDPATRWHVLEL